MDFVAQNPYWAWAEDTGGQWGAIAYPTLRAGSIPMISIKISVQPQVFFLINYANFALSALQNAITGIKKSLNFSRGNTPDSQSGGGRPLPGIGGGDGGRGRQLPLQL